MFSWSCSQACSQRYAFRQTLSDRLSGRLSQAGSRTDSFSGRLSLSRTGILSLADSLSLGQAFSLGQILSLSGRLSGVYSRYCDALHDHSSSEPPECISPWHLRCRIPTCDCCIPLHALLDTREAGYHAGLESWLYAPVLCFDVWAVNCAPRVRSGQIDKV